MLVLDLWRVWPARWRRLENWGCAGLRLRSGRRRKTPGRRWPKSQGPPQRLWRL